jgi:hypothetical protein
MNSRIPFIPELIFSFATDIAGVWIRGSKYAKIAIGFAIALAAAAAVSSFFDSVRAAQFFGVSAAVLIIGVLAYQRALERSERAEKIFEIEKEAEANPNKAKPAWILADSGDLVTHLRLVAFYDASNQRKKIL